VTGCKPKILLGQPEPTESDLTQDSPQNGRHQSLLISSILSQFKPAIFLLLCLLLLHLSPSPLSVDHSVA
jgi:hypothetical protein